MLPDTTQILLVVIITVLTVLLTAVGVQVFLILKEVRHSVEQLNKILNNAGEVAAAISRPIASLADSVTGLSGITGLLGWLINHKRKNHAEEETAV
ncbi:hypothetical protein COT66_01855 [Candidatus Shapirobacteria bacterium CG09_land_8_20_14_0_10_49_15]|uniref:DUF948 domain-containing protein n=1 Tax=Candidatus Shapirobacteria bacterium CG09_land_8_20_14_0_10_49_15 TaxID=1974482 RepID=A0A2M6XAZ9_9BACT|nr:MAG: hypothetical protein COT66_01855 [Candidatus Shapirobacteria bacterium CG09_land_8_20_14_0_10_49_15]